MDLHSGTVTSLRYAVSHARSNREHSAARETMQFWHELIVEARDARQRCSRFEGALARELDRLIEALHAELTLRAEPVPSFEPRLRLDPA